MAAPLKQAKTAEVAMKAVSSSAGCSCSVAPTSGPIVAPWENAAPASSAYLQGLEHRGNQGHVNRYRGDP